MCTLMWNQSETYAGITASPHGSDVMDNYMYTLNITQCLFYLESLSGLLLQYTKLALVNKRKSNAPIWGLNPQRLNTHLIYTRTA